MSAAQFELVIEDINAAMREIVRALGGAEAVGIRLHPEKTPTAAAQVVNDCLNPDRRARFNPEQVWLLFVWARQAGFHSAKRWFDEATGYTPGEPVEPEDERARVQREFIAAKKEMALMLARLERLDSAPATKVRR